MGEWCNRYISFYSIRLFQHKSICKLKYVACLSRFPPHQYAPPKENSALIRIEILGFPDCPNTPEFGQRVQAAANEVGGFVLVAVDQQTLPTNDVRRGYPAPTALVHGRDLFGLPIPTSPTLSCRTYAGGLPSVNEIAANLKAARGPQ